MVNLLEIDTQAFLLVSVHIDEPRPGGALAVSRSVDWRYRTTLIKPPVVQTFRHIHQVVIENTNNVEMRVTVRALRLAET